MRAPHNRGSLLERYSSENAEVKVVRGIERDRPHVDRTCILLWEPQDPTIKHAEKAASSLLPFVMSDSRSCGPG